MIIGIWFFEKVFHAQVLSTLSIGINKYQYLNTDISPMPIVIINDTFGSFQVDWSPNLRQVSLNIGYCGTKPVFYRKKMLLHEALNQVYFIIIVN